MRSFIWVTTAFVVLCTIPVDLRAQEVIYKKHTVVDFGDDTIDGNLSRPDGQYLDSRKRQNHQKLIKVRLDFRPEILSSVGIL
jgi:hypothetical protein